MPSQRHGRLESPGRSPMIATLWLISWVPAWGQDSPPPLQLPHELIPPPRRAALSSTAPAPQPVDSGRRPVVPPPARNVVTRPDSRMTLTAGPAEPDAQVPQPPTIHALTAPKAVARFEGTAAPGLRVGLNAEGTTGAELRYLWVQTQGPEVRIDRADTPKASFIVPAGAKELAFHLIVAGRGGVDRKVVRIPVESAAMPMPPVVAADPGDDQVAVVNHRVTLNGLRSIPSDRAAFRWIQVAGPEVLEWNEEGKTCSFVPVEPGTYRFLLVVAADGAISRPAAVQVVVESEGPPGVRPSARVDLIDRFARGCLRDIEGSRALATPLADAFDQVAERMPLYHDYAEAQSELVRRVGAILPTDAGRRDSWDRLVFEPLSDQIVEALRGTGLDLDGEGAELGKLTGEQRARLAALFRGIARGFRAGSQVGDDADGQAAGGHPTQEGSQ